MLSEEVEQRDSTQFHTGAPIFTLVLQLAQQQNKLQKDESSSILLLDKFRAFYFYSITIYSALQTNREIQSVNTLIHAVHE